MIALDLRPDAARLADIDQILKTRHPYKSWLRQGCGYLESDLVDARPRGRAHDRDTLSLYQKMFNVTQEERDDIIRVLRRTRTKRGLDGRRTPMPVLSHTVRSLYDYFRQQFAQVTNPPIDSLRESIVCRCRRRSDRNCNIFVPRPSTRPDRARSPISHRGSCARSWQSRRSRTNFSTCSRARGGPCDRHRAPVRAGGERGARGEAGAVAVGSYLVRGRIPATRCW